MNIKIFSLTPAQANILKQTALTVGADCATHREVITGQIELSDAILTGSLSQLKKIATKLQSQPFNLKNLGKQINEYTTKRNVKTKITGILNVTPDSFSDGGCFYNPDDAIIHLTEMLEDGADMIDIGAESTRPYSQSVNPDEQIKRLKPVIEFINKENIQIPISVDTRSSVVADFVLQNGIDIINDVSGFEYDKKMPEIIAKYNAGVIIQHTKGTPENMQNNPKYDNVIEEIFFALKAKIELAESLGITNIIADAGIGFGKSSKDCFEILERIDELYSLNVPIMAGISRKSFLGIKDNDNSAKDALSLAVSYPLMQKGIDYLRVHNVKLHKLMLKNI